jgi:hydroxymethylglutaryl-CoA synthase
LTSEKFDNVSAGKYTIGLGQQRLSYVEDREDVYSISLSGALASFK